MLCKKVKSVIKKYSLILPGERVLVGLSGGADSMCLTHVLHTLSREMGFEITAAHLNHHIRGNEALRDAAAAAELSKKLGIEFVLGDADVIGYAKKTGMSEELAGRELRYDFFEKTAEKYGCKKIATAHNKNDNAETLLMNLTRGSGLSGLSGIPVRRGRIIRPLLGISRREIEDYCVSNGLEYVTDSTNNGNKYTRNRVRHILLPCIEKEFNPAFIDTAAENAELIRADNELLNEIAAKTLAESMRTDAMRGTAKRGAAEHDGAADIEVLKNAHPSILRRVIKMLMAEAGCDADFSSAAINSAARLIYSGKSGSAIDLPKGLEAKITYGRLTVGRKPVPTDGYEYKLTLNEDVYIKEAGITVRVEKAEIREDDGVQYFSNADVDYIRIRSRRNGDYFYPAGMGGRKKLKDYFIDEKIPRELRERTPILTFGGEIAYIIGMRRDERFKFTGKGIKLKVL